MSNTNDRYALGPGPGRIAAIVDIIIYIAAAGGFFGIEVWLRSIGKFPYPGLFDGGLSLLLSFFVVAGIMKWRGQEWSAFGLRKPARWWTIPLWGFLVIVVNVVAQLTVVPLLGKLLNVPPPDLTRYDAIVGNLSLFLTAAIGAMMTGGFIEEFIYRGMMVDRLARIFGGGRRGVVAAALLCGVPFGLVHFKWGIGGMFVTAVMGAVLGLMYLATRRNLWPLVAGHAVLDFILMLQVYMGSFK